MRVVGGIAVTSEAGIWAEGPEVTEGVMIMTSLRVDCEGCGGVLQLDKAFNDSSLQPGSTAIVTCGCGHENGVPVGKLWRCQWVGHRKVWLGSIGDRCDIVIERRGRPERLHRNVSRASYVRLALLDLDVGDGSVTFILK